MLFEWFCKYFVFRPSILYSGVNGAFIHSEFLSPFRHCHGYPVKRQYSRASGVPSLLSQSRPFAVLRTVVAIIVSAFNGMFGCWPISHVVNKYSKIIPTRTYGYASSAVIRITRISMIVTPLAHRFPYTIIFMRRKAMNSKSIFSYTPARFNRFMSLCKMSITNNRFISAVTFTQPSRWPSEDLSERNKPTKPTSSNIYCIVVNWYKISFSHIATRFSNVIRGRLFPQPVLHYSMVSP